MDLTRSKPITLSAALMLGVALGFAIPWEKRVLAETSQASAKGSTVSSPHAGAPASLANSKSSVVRTPVSSTADPYSTAWELLKDGQLRRSERRALESALLEEWCKADLRAALHAAFGEEWSVGGLDPSLLSDCHGGFLDKTDLLRELVSSREYGLHTHELRSEWIQACAWSHPRGVIRRLPELPAESIAEAIAAVVASTHGHLRTQPEKDEVIATVLAYRGTPHEAAAMEGFTKGVSAMETRELAALIRDPPDPALRQLYLDAYVSYFVRSSSKPSHTELEQLPTDLRAEVEESIRSRERN